MPRWRALVPVAFLLAVSMAVLGAVGESRDRARVAGDDTWDSVKLAVARNNVGSQVRFFRSLQYWTHPPYGERAAAEEEFVVVGGDVTAALVLPAKQTVHIHGDLAAALRVGEYSEIVIGGSVLKGARIDAEGIVAIHVQKHVEGVVACTSSAELWIGGDLRGDVLTGVPVMRLHVAGNLTGSVRPITEAALLYLGVEGYAASSTLAAIASRQYTELQMSVAASDTPLGVYPLSNARNGFVAVTGR